MNLTDWVVGNLKPYKLALNSPTRIGSFLPTIYGCVLPTLTPLLLSAFELFDLSFINCYSAQPSFDMFVIFKRNIALKKF